MPLLLFHTQGGKLPHNKEGNTMKNQPIPNDQASRLVDLKFMCTQSGLSKAYFYKLVAAGQLPKPIKFGRASRWPYSDYQGLVAKLEAKRTPVTNPTD